MLPVFTPEQPCHTHAVEALNDLVFGPHRHTRTVARLRRNVAPVGALCLVAINPADQALLGSIRYWPILLGGSRQPALMLGPVVSHPSLQGRKMAGLADKTVAAALIETSLTAARDLSSRFPAVVLKAASPCLVPYYERFGFDRTAVAGLHLPGPDSVAESALLMGRELTPGGLRGLAGVIASAPRHAPSPPTRSGPTKILQFA